MSLMKPEDLWNLEHTGHAQIFEGVEHAWDALKGIRGLFEGMTEPNGRSHERPGVTIGDLVWIGEDVEIEDGVLIKGPAIIGDGTVIRHNAYLREYVVIGKECVLGNACEFKNCLLFDGCQVPHFNYVGDSILGYKAHLGAGVKISNVKLVPGNVKVMLGGQLVDSGLRKFGALLGDHAEVGCNTVLNPGSILGAHAVVYPNVCWRGHLPAHSIARNEAPVGVRTRRPAP